MAIRLGDEAPDSARQPPQARSTFHQWLGDSWGVLFSHPADFTPVCTTELGAVANIEEEFKKRDVKIIALSVNSVDDHADWIADINETQKRPCRLPLIADPERKVAELYDMIHPNALDNMTVRSVFVIAGQKGQADADLFRPQPAATSTKFCA